MTEKNTAYEQMMFADYPDIVGIEDLQKMLDIGRKSALELAKHPKIHGVIVGNEHRKCTATCIARLYISFVFPLNTIGALHPYYPASSAVPDTLTVDEVAELTGYHRRTVLLYMQRKYIYAVNITGK